MTHNFIPNPSLFLTAILSCAVMACSGLDPQVSLPSDEEHRAKVEMVRLAHAIPAESDGTDTPSLATFDSVHKFMNSVDVGYGDVVILDSAPDVAPARLVSLEKFIKARGVSYGGLQAVGKEPASGTVILHVERHIVIAPECGTFKSEATRDRKNNPSGHHGCSTSRNLALMVANPRDLTDGVSHATSTSSAIMALQRLNTQRRRGISNNNAQVQFLNIQPAASAGGN